MMNKYKSHSQLRKKQAKTGLAKDTIEEKTIPIDTVITLDHLTNPDKK